MKKIYQKVVVSVSAGAGVSVVVSERLRNDFDRCVGVVVIKSEQSAKAELHLKIGGVEIIPTGTDIDLLCFNGTSGREDSIYYFNEDKIPARSSDAEISIKNILATACIYSIYFILEND